MTNKLEIMLRACFTDSRVYQNCSHLHSGVYRSGKYLSLCRPGTAWDIHQGSIPSEHHLCVLGTRWKGILILERKRSGARTQPYFSSVLNLKGSNLSPLVRTLTYILKETWVIFLHAFQSISLLMVSNLYWCNWSLYKYFDAALCSSWHKLP